MPVQLTQKERDLIEKMGSSAEKKEKVLEVKDLRISFKTDNGKVQAVRGVSFDLYKQETLCIVGESGSGKSVTSKAIMGILSPNAIVEGGEILYQGEDLLKVSEEEFHRIRGHKIGMIFQDPLSSLNPIVKIGKQITETLMINSDQLKNRYNELIAKELSAYKNEKAIENASISLANVNYNRFKEKYEKAIGDLANQIHLDKTYLSALAKKKPLPEGVSGTSATFEADLNEKSAQKSRLESEYKAKDPAAKAEQKQAIADAKALYKKNAPALKEALTKRKAEAKIDNEAYKKKADEDFRVSLEAVEKKRAAIVLSPEKTKRLEEIDQAIRRLEIKRQLLQKSLYFLQKKRDAALAKIDAELNPLLKERDQIRVDYLAVDKEEAAVREAYQEKVRITKAMAKRRALEVMKEVGIPQPEKRYYQYPFQFSGGMRQRIVIAIALTAAPDILICDEPTTALDVTIQAQILELINKLKEQRHLSCIFITHDLGVVANMADRVAVMYAGRIVEYGTDKEVFFDPRHPYTWALLSSIPDIDSKEKLEAIPGTPPDMIYPPVGDAFAARNKYALAIDYKYQPPYFKITDTHFVATWLEHPSAPKIEPPAIVTTRIKNALKDEEAKISHGTR
jgi:oligopeptide/dipeptide ABC transporter ATP-binding protein